ncbi:MAG: 2-C-methyl-D-erythritol 4-phosphate cytidylyltransferase, partial [Mucilaginibacter sp.]|nr:2-C-methyl-D-erythritol 4-phosphate cytidylyltransferase [Mucilaginibacter sp.]
MTNDFPKYAIIVAGGSGSRMQSAIPKQFLLLAGIPVLMHT